jgi:hypothetical protein
MINAVHNQWAKLKWKYPMHMMVPLYHTDHTDHPVCGHSGIVDMTERLSPLSSQVQFLGGPIPQLIELATRLSGFPLRVLVSYITLQITKYCLYGVNYTSS